MLVNILKKAKIRYYYNCKIIKFLNSYYKKCLLVIMLFLTFFINFYNPFLQSFFFTILIN